MEKIVDREILMLVLVLAECRSVGKRLLAGSKIDVEGNGYQPDGSLFPDSQE